MSSHIERIKANIELQQEKINLFERELILVVDVAQKFSLEKKLEDERNRLEQLKKGLATAEKEKATADQGLVGDDWEEKKEHWKILVATQEIDRLFDELKSTLKSKRQRSMVIQMMANYNMIRNQDMLNIENPESIARRYRQANHNLISFIDSLEERHAEESPY